jgi:hypothetical protein
MKWNTTYQICADNVNYWGGGDYICAIERKTEASLIASKEAGLE